MGILIRLNLLADNELNVSIHNDDDEADFCHKKTRPVIADFNISLNKSPKNKNPPNGSVSETFESANTDMAERNSENFEPTITNFETVNASMEGVSEDFDTDVIDLTDEPIDGHRSDPVEWHNKSGKNNEESLQPQTTMGYYMVEKILGSRLNPATKKHEFLLSLKDCATNNSWNSMSDSQGVDWGDPDSVLYVQKCDDQINPEQAPVLNSSEADNAKNEVWKSQDVEEPVTFKRDFDEYQPTPRAINGPSSHEGEVLNETTASPNGLNCTSDQPRGLSFADGPLTKDDLELGERMSFRCTLCPRTFWAHHHLKKHYRTHTRNKEYRCTMCGCAYCSTTLLKHHLEKAHRIRYHRSRLWVEKCKKMVRKAKPVKEEPAIKEEAIEGDTQIHQGSASHKCPHCYKLFDSTWSFQKHKNGQTPCRSSCAICNRKLYYYWQRKTHAKTHQNALAVASTSVESNISGQSELSQCTRCDKKFTFRADALHHQQWVHETERNKCFMCGLTFKVGKNIRQSMHRHMHLHTDETRYKCELCDYRCIKSTELKNHVKAKHPLITEYLFSA